MVCCLSVLTWDRLATCPMRTLPLAHISEKLPTKFCLQCASLFQSPFPSTSGMQILTDWQTSFDKHTFFCDVIFAKNSFPLHQFPSWVRSQAEQGVLHPSSVFQFFQDDAEVLPDQRRYTTIPILSEFWVSPKGLHPWGILMEAELALYDEKEQRFYKCLR